MSSYTFKEIVEKSGWKINENGQGLMDVYPVNFVQNVTTTIRNHSKYPSVKEDFIQGFSEFIEDATSFQSCLDSITLSSEISNSSIDSNDSLVRLLLKVVDIQPLLCKVLLEKLAELSAVESNTTNESQLAKSIICQFRWLNTLVDGSDFCDKLLEVFPILNVDLQKGVIVLVPEVVDDKNHHKIALAWIDLLKVNSELTLPILNSLSNLTLSSDILSELKAISMNLIDSITVEDLPAIIKIILHSLTLNEASQLLQLVKLKLSSFFDSRMSGSIQQDQSTGVLIISTFERALRSKQFIGNELLKHFEIEKNANFEKSSCLNIFLLLMLINTPTWGRKAEQTFLNCIKRGFLKNNNLETAFKTFPEICIKYFQSVKILAEKLSKKNEMSVQSIGGYIYYLSFIHLNDQVVQQKVIENLIAHIKNGNTTEIDGALDILLQLSASESNLFRYGAYLKNVTDDMGKMNLVHVRKIYLVLSQVAFTSRRPNTTDRGLHDKMHLIIRKQLINSNQRYRLMGVIGAVSGLKSLVSCEKNQNLSMDDLQAASSIINLIESQVLKDCYANSLYYDELSRIMESGNIDHSFQKLLANKVVNSFQELYIADGDEDTLIKIPGVNGAMQFDLNGNVSEQIVVNFLQISTNENGKIDLKNRCVDSQLPSHFRLLQICSQTSGDDGLRDIDAVLGCPVHFLSNGYLDRFNLSSEKEKKFILKCCFSICNYFIELINAFATQPDARQKVYQRLKIVVWLREKINTFIPTSGYVPFVVRTDVEDSALSLPSSSGIAMKRKANFTKSKQVKRRKKRARNDDEDDEPSLNSPIHSEDELCDESKTKTQKNLPSAINLSLYEPCFRELDLEVFTLLHADLSFSESSKPCLSVNEAQFLYNDLMNKVKVLNEATNGTKKSIPFFKKSIDPCILNSNLLNRPRQHLLDSVMSLPRFCRRHLDNICSYLGINTDVIYSSGQTSRVVENVEELMNLFLVIFTIIEDMMNLVSDSRTHFLKLLQKLCQKGNDPSQQDFISATKNYLLDIIEKSPSISISILVLRCLQKCKLKLPEFDVNLGKAAKTIFSTNWADPDRKLLPIKNTDISQLLKIWLDESDDPLNLINEYLSDIEDKIKEAESLLISKKTLHLYYDIFFSKLTSYLDLIHKSKLTSLSIEQQFSNWSLSVQVFHSLVNLTKVFENIKILSLSLKYSRSFLISFIRFGLPVLNSCFRKQKEKILHLLKVLQQSTRILQNICGHSKCNQTLSLIDRVPPLKKELERVVFQVKRMLAHHKCSDAIFIGNLKNRTLKGEEILSQQSSHDKENDDDDDEKDKTEEDENKFSDAADSGSGNESDASNESTCY